MFETRSQAWQEVGLMRQIVRAWSSARAWRCSCWCRCSWPSWCFYDNRVSLLGTESQASTRTAGVPAHKVLEPAARNP